MLVGIEWRAVPWAPAYEVSYRGDVRKRINATHPERRQTAPIRPFTDEDGYLRAQVDGRKWHVHRLVYAAFCGPLVPGKVVCHIDGSRTNNTPENLVQATQRENVAHKRAHGTHQVGEKHGRSLYSDAQIAELKQAIAASPRSATGRLRRGIRQELAARFGVSPHVVADIARGKTWSNA